MISFDIASVVRQAFITVWNERHYLLKLAIAPLIVKVICFFLSILFGEEGNIIRLSLMMIPAYFVEGWMICHFVRLIVMGNRWPTPLTGDTVEDIRLARLRGKPLLAGIIGFVLINLAVALYYATFFSLIPDEMLQGGQVDPETFPPQDAFMITFMFMLMIAAFKYIWFFIPLSCNISVASFLYSIRGLMTSFKLIAVWVICFAPVAFIMQISLSIFPAGEAQGFVISDGIIAMLRILFDTLKNIICAAGITYALLQLFSGRVDNK